jgi:hypothetical protein
MSAYERRGGAAGRGCKRCDWSDTSYVPEVPAVNPSITLAFLSSHLNILSLSSRLYP